jgi:uncharacterized protein DUF2846
MKRFLLVLTALFLLSLGACSPYIPQHMALNEQQPAISPISGKAALVVCRQETSPFAYGSAADVNVFLDNEFIGQTTTYSYFVKQVDPGVHYVFSYALVIAQAAPVSTVRFDFEEGKTYYLMHDVRSPPMAFTTLTSTEPIAPSDVDMAELKYMDFNSSGGAVVLPDVDRKAAMEEFDQNPGNYESVMNYKGY